MTKKGINSKTTIKKKRTYKKRTKKVSSKVLKPVVINDKVAEPVIPDVIVPDDSMMDKISQEFSETIPDDSTIPDVIIPDTSVSNISNNDSEPILLKSRKEPPKNISSVNIEQAEAPPISYAGTISVTKASGCNQPFDGLLRLNSAM